MMERLGFIFVMKRLRFMLVALALFLPSLLNAEARNADTLNADTLNADTLNADTLNADTLNAEAQTADAINAETLNADSLDMDEYLYGHVSDAYEWHLTTVKGREIAIPLPVILYSRNSGWHCFLSSRLEHGEQWKGFSIVPADGGGKGRIMETLPDGRRVRPLDLSVTKNVAGLLINSILLVLLVLFTARWYRRHDARKEVPTGVPGLMEMVVTMVEDDIAKDCIGKDYRRYSPYLLTAFFFILINNLMGLVPFFPGGANITGNIAVTLVLALFTFFAVNIFGNRHYWKDIFWPEVPTWLKVPLPLMPAIEVIGMFTKPFSLMIRLFANILAGHFMILGVVAVIFLTAELGTAMNAGLGVVAIVLGVFMDILELLVAFIQAYVFTMLSAVFIGLSRQTPE